MSLTEQTAQCPICKQPYKVYGLCAGDQSACQECVRKASNKCEIELANYIQNNSSLSN